MSTTDGATDASNSTDPTTAAPGAPEPTPTRVSTPPAYVAPPAYTSTPGYPASPHYGAAPEYGPPYNGYAKARTNTLAIVSLVASVVGLVLIPLLGSVTGVITGHMALEQIKRTGEEGRGQALAGTITGYIGLAFGVPAVVAFFAFLPVMMASIDKYL